MGMGGIRRVGLIGCLPIRACEFLKVWGLEGFADEGGRLGLSPFLREKLVERLRLEEAALD